MGLGSQHLNALWAGGQDLTAQITVISEERGIESCTTEVRVLGVVSKLQETPSTCPTNQAACKNPLKC